MRCPGRVIACVIALWGKVERWGLNSPLYLPSGCMDNSCPSICPFFTPFHDRSPSLVPLSSVAGGEVYAGFDRLRRLEAEWCQGAAGGAGGAAGQVRTALQGAEETDGGGD